MENNEDLIYRNNCRVFETLYPRLFYIYKKKLEEQDKVDSRFEFSFFNGKKGHPTFSVKTPDGTVMHGHSIYDPYQEAEKKFQGITFDEGDRIVLLGFGFGYHIEHLLKIAPKCQIIAVEPFITVFDAALRNRNLLDILKTPRVLPTIRMDPESLSYSLGAGASPLNLPRFRVFTLPYFNLLPDLQNLISDTMANFRDYLMFNLFTGFFAGDTFFKNTVNNFLVAVRSPGINALKDQFKNRPVFVIAPGPSLEKNMDELKKVKGKALIIAVDTATKILRTRDIIPDVIITVDYQTANYEKFKGVDTSASFLVPAIEVCPEIPEHHTGKAFTYYHSGATAELYDPILERKGLLGSGGSVLTDAFNLAVHMGGNPIIFAGVDLGFPGKKWYADGSFEGGKFTRNIQEGKVELIEVPDIYGNPMPTYRSFYSFLRYFNSLIPSLETKVIDATEGGARITGTEIMTLRDAIEQYVTEPYDPIEILTDIHEKFSPPDLKELSKKIIKYEKKYDEITTQTSKAFEGCEKALRMIEKKKFDEKLIRKLKKIKNIKSKIKKEGKYIDFMASALERMMAAVFYYEEDENAPREERYRIIVEMSKMLFENIHKSSQFVKAHFSEIVERLRKEEI